MKNAKKTIAEFKERLSTELKKKQEKLDIAKKRFQKRRVTKKVYNKDIIKLRQ